MIEITIFNNSAFTQQVTLDGSIYQVSLIWNGRDDAWFISFAEQDGTPILDALKIVPGYELIRRFKDSRLPPGALLTADMTDTGDYPTRDNLGVDVKLVYMTEAEVNAAL